MKPKICLILLFLFSSLPVFTQTTLQGRAAADFFTAFAQFVIDGRRFTALEDLTPYIPLEVLDRLDEDLVYRVAFIGFAANQLGTMSGRTNSVGFPQTLTALTGFLMIIEESGEMEEWTMREITNRYEQLLATSWRNVNPSLFAFILEAYTSYRRGELWR